MSRSCCLQCGSLLAPHVEHQCSGGQRKILGLKDEQGAYVKTSSGLPQGACPDKCGHLGCALIEKAQPKLYTEPMRHDVSLDDLLSRCLLVLWREVYNLQEASSGGHKLNEEQAKELRENTRLLMELKRKEKDLLDGLSDDELKELDSIKRGSKPGRSAASKAKTPTEGI